MSRFGEVMKNVIIGSRKPEQFYHRILVVSAYGGITNQLLENKKTGEPGVYASFAAGQTEWTEKLEEVRSQMLKYNHQFASLGLDLSEADGFVNERIDGLRSCLQDLVRVRSYGHLLPDNYLPATRELLSAAGEAHSAFNSTLILRSNGINARLLDLSCWMETEILPLDEVILRAFKDVDLSSELPVVTGYVKCDDGIMTHFGRGYSEYTFSKVCVLTKAREGIIHKEFHLCSGDPVLMGADRVKVIGNTNFDIADQMSDMAMEAIHSRAAKEMELQDIPLRVMNAFEPEHPGTLISKGYVSPEPKVEMVTGREDMLAIEVFDPEMVGQAGYDHRLLRPFYEVGISYIAKSTNANTITHYVPEGARGLEHCLELLKTEFSDAQVKSFKVAIISVLGTNMPFPNAVADATRALTEARIDILGMNVSTHRVNIQFIVSRENSQAAQLALHAALVED